MARIRQGGARLYILNAQPIKLKRKANQFVKVPLGGERAAVAWLASGQGNLDAAAAPELAALSAALEKENDVVIVFGSELSGAAIGEVVAFGSRLPGQTRYLALGDYANSRGAADMGLLPDRLPGYALVSDAAAREAYGKLWDAQLPEKPGLTAQQMLDAASNGKLKALYVVGANPVKTFGVPPGEKARGLDLLIVQELFLTETAQRADIVLPAACAYEKDGTVTNTAGEVQLLRKAAEVMGPRADFDILRLLSHLLSKAGLGRAIPLRTPEDAFEEIRRTVSGYDVAMASLLTGGAAACAPSVPADGHAPHDVPPGAIFSSRDTLFTSGSLGRYCTMLNSVPEAVVKP